jgi:predicted RND superfamily exporter protein
MNKSTQTNNWKPRLEQAFGQLGRTIAKHPLIWFLGYVILVGSLASQLIHIRQDTSVEGFLEKGSQEIIKYDEFKSIFGRDEVLMIGLEAEDIFDPKFVDELRALHNDIESNVPHVKRVDSLINARHTYGADDTLYIEELMPEVLPEDETELQKLKDYTYGNPNYVNYLISEDGHYTAIVIQLEAFKSVENKQGDFEQKYLEDTDLKEVLSKLYSIIAVHEKNLGIEIDVAGSVPISIMIGSVMERDFSVFTALAIFLIGLILAVIFRRASGVSMPLIVMVLGVIATLSAMAIMDTPIQVSTSILPSFLLAVCVGDSIHLLTMFYRYYDEGEEKVDALAHAMEHTGLAIFFTSITTAAGLASFAASDITAVAALGFYGALGSIVAFVLTIFILPCLIALLPLKRKQHSYKESDSRLQTFLARCADFSIRFPKQIVAVGAVIFLSSAYVASQVQFSHWPMAWLPDDSSALRAIHKHEAHMGGSLAIEFMIDTGESRGISNPEFMKNLNEVSSEIQSWQTDTYRVAKVISVTDIIKESNRALHDNDQNFYTIPNSAELIAQELFLVELDEPDDLYNMIDQDYRRARISILVPWIDAIHLVPLLKRSEVYVNEKLSPFSVEIVQTGVTPVLGATFAEMLYSTAQSYGIAAVVITIMMILLIGNLKLGLISMIPSLIPIFIVLAGFTLANVSLDMLTMLVGSIAIGLTVDDNVHFMHGFRRIYAQTGDPALAIRKTLSSSGRAMLITSIVLSVGFFIYTQSEMKNMVSFGIMTACCIALALVATFLLAPALMMLTNKKIDMDSGKAS